MEKCAICQTPLDPAWKFCVTCGTPTLADASSAGAPKTKRAKTKVAKAQTPAQIPTQFAHVLTEDIPAAIRNSEDGPPARTMGRRTVNVPLIVSVSLGAAGTILIVYLVILVFGTRG